MSNPAISDSKRCLNYDEAEEVIKSLMKKLTDKGIGKHRILVKGHVKKEIEDFLWLDACWGLGGTATLINETYSESEVQHFIEDFDPIAMIVENEVQMLGDPHKINHDIPEGIVAAMKTSGTTGKSTYKFYNFWRSPGYRSQANSRGVTIDSSMNLTRMMIPRKPPVYGEIGTFQSSYPQYNYMTCRQMGGHYHIINYEDDIVKELNRYKVSFIASWPNAVKNMIISHSKPGDFPYLEGIQLAGQACPLDVLKEMREWFPNCTFANLFGSAEADCYAVAFNKPGDTNWDDFYKLGVLTDLADVKCEDGVMYYRYDNKDWMSDGDGGTMHPDGRITFTGRVNQDYITKGNGIKVWCKPVESQATDIEGVERAYVVQRDINNHALLYTGTANIEDVKKSLMKLSEYKRPNIVWQVKEGIWYTGEKLSRYTLYRELENYPEFIESSSEIAV